MLDHDTVLRAYERSAGHLLSLAEPAGHWTGELSSSALSTAVALFALHQADAAKHRPLVEGGISWLIANANSDGGWGDTPDSPSNLSTTLLAWSALSAASRREQAYESAVRNAERWLCGRTSDLAPGTIARAVLNHYGKDWTFSAPILTLCALAGKLGPEPECWGLVPQLPFELSVLPNSFYKWLSLSVVSYALPALVAIGYVRHVRTGARSLLRRATAARALQLLREIQPNGGGFLEAAPLTAFVTLSLACAGMSTDPATLKATDFLVASARKDGSWGDP